MKRANIIINAWIPVLWIIMFFMIKYDIGRLDYGTIYISLWIAIPIMMFILNTFLETQLKRLVLLYLISAGLQVLGVLIEGVLYYNFIGSDPGTSVVVRLSVIITALLNFFLALIGVVTKSIILKFEKSESFHFARNQVVKKITIPINMFLPVFWLVLFSITQVIWDLNYGTICSFLWIAIPIMMFILNTFTEMRVKRLALLYLISAVMQILGVWISMFLYSVFIKGELGISAVGQLIILITALLNLILSIIGIAIKSLILRFKKQ